MSAAQHIILGIDPGLERTGFAVISLKDGVLTAEDFGIFTTDKNSELPGRLLQIGADLDEILDLWKPQALAIENLVFVKNISSGLLVAQARGVILEHVERKKLPIFQFLPTAVKKALTGNGQAPKIQMQRMVQRIFNLAHIPQPDDAADALAIAYTGLGHLQLTRQLR